MDLSAHWFPLHQPGKLLGAPRAAEVVGAEAEIHAVPGVARPFEFISVQGAQAALDGRH